ncbi:glycosyltransferase [Oceanobacillus caeni]
MKTIVILSGVPYDSSKQRPQHFASYFARNGYEVLYIFLYDFDKIDPELIINLKSREYLLNLFSRNPDNIYFLKNKVNKETLKTSSLTLLINKIIEVYGGENITFISAFPEWIMHLESIPECSTLIYDCSDEWEEFIKDVDFGYTEKLIYNERKMASIADLVIVSAKKLYLKMSLLNDNIYYLPNGVWNDDYKFKGESHHIPRDLKYIKEPIVFFMGAVAEWVDIELIRFTAESRPQYSFIFVGNQRSKLPQLSNIYFLGSKNYEDLPNYLEKAKVAIIPFKVNNLTAAVTPLKFYEYLSSGTPVVTTIMPDIIDLKGSKTALDKYDFVNYLDYYINMDEISYEREVNHAINTAKSFDWEYLLKPIASLLVGENINFDSKETFINKLIQGYNLYCQNNLIKNELLNAYNRLEKYENSVSLFNTKKINEKIDFEKLALAYIKVNKYEKAIQYLQKYIEISKKSVLLSYVNSLLSENDNKDLIEIYLLKLSGNIYEGLKLTDGLVDKYGMQSKLLGLLAGLYLDIGEYEIAFQFALNTLHNLKDYRIEEVLDVYTISFLTKSLAEKFEFKLAEEIALTLIPISKEWEDKATEMLSEIYVSAHMA